jgi:hypothetical protein
VYEPDWASESRTRYTIDLIRIQTQLLGDESEGSISTLPVGWRSGISGVPGAVERAAENLLRVAHHLHVVEADTGKLIHLDLEPEPGCFLETSGDVVEFFNEHLLPRGDEEIIRRHLRVCHDVCHAAIMFEDQAEALGRYDNEGIAVGKVQLSSALRIRFDHLGDEDRRAALAQLHRFDERRYLHQTVVKTAGGGRETVFFEDLVDALASCHGAKLPDGEWRVHFHVPLFMERFDRLETTSNQLLELLVLAGRQLEVRHFEAETYAWDVLPAELKCDSLADGIARELTWLRDQSAARSAAS